MTLGDITGVVALLLSIVLIIKGFFESRNLQKTGGNIDSSTIANLQKALNEAVDLNRTIPEQMASFEIKLTQQETEHKLEISRIKEAHALEMEELNAMYADVKDWAERLVLQVKSLGGIPVQIRSRKKQSL
jgi:hypothetical protein